MGFGPLPLIAGLFLVLPLWSLPYVAGSLYWHLTQRNWGRVLGWAVALLVVFYPALYLLSNLDPSDNTYGFDPFVTPIHVWVMLGQTIFWWYSWFTQWKKREINGRRIAAIPAFIISAIIAIKLSPLLSIVVLLIIWINHSNEKRKWDKIEYVVPKRSAADADVEPDETRDLSEIGYRPYPNADLSDAKTVITGGGGSRGKSVKFKFRTADPPDQVLEFYRKSAEQAGMRVRTGLRLAENPDYPPVPALVALKDEPVALVVSRDTYHEFEWTVTVWLKIWASFTRDLQAYFDFEEPLVDVSAAEQEQSPKREMKPASEYSVFQQRKEEEASRDGAETDHTGQPPPPPPRPPRPRRKPIDWGEIIEKHAPVLVIWAGVTILVLGLGFLLSTKAGVTGKVISVYAIFLVMWGMGIHFERTPLLSTFGKGLLAGGWAGFYVTTFLVHYLPEARVIQDPTLGVVILSIIAIGMIAHSFRYNSQVLTTFTYLVAFITISFMVHMADQRFFSLVATAVLALSMLFILYKKQWHQLVMFSILGCYGTHIIWLNPFNMDLKPMGGMGSEMLPGLGMLLIYWVTFTIAVYLFRPKNEKQAGINLWMTAANFFLFFSVFRFQLGPDNTFWRMFVIQGLAVAYIGLMFLAHVMKRPKLYTLNLVIAAICTTMALYYHFLGSNWVTIGWLLQAEGLYVAGLLANDKRFRNIGIVNFVLVGAWMITHDYTLPDQINMFGTVFFQRTLIFATVAVVFYINAILRHVMSWKIGDEHYAYLFSYSASILWGILMLRNWYPDHLLNAAVTSAVLGVFLMETGIRLWDHHFRIQGLFFVFISVIAALFPLMSSTTFYYPESMAYRIFCEAVVIVLAYFVFARFQKRVAAEEDTRHIELATGMFSSVAAVIAVMLLYREFSTTAPMWIVLAWMVLGILLIEIGMTIRNQFFRVQGYLITALTLIWAVYNFFSLPDWLGIGSLNFFAQILVTFGFFYLFYRILSLTAKDSPTISGMEKAEGWLGNGPLLAALFSVSGTLILTLTIWRELTDIRPLYIAVAWLAVSVALLEVGVAANSRPLRLQALVISAVAFLYALFHNLTPGDESFGPFSDNVITLLLCVGAMYYIYERIQRAEAESREWVDIPYASTVLSWLAGILLMLLIYREVGREWPHLVDLAWVVPMLAFLFVGIIRKSPNFLSQSFAVSSLIFIRAFAMKVTGIGAFYQSSMQGENYFVPLVPFATIFYGDVMEWDFVLSQVLVSAIPIIIIFYGVFLFLNSRNTDNDFENFEQAHNWLRTVSSWWATILLAHLISNILLVEHGFFLPMLWMLMAIVLFEVGLWIRSSTLVIQGNTLAIVAILRSLTSVFMLGDDPEMRTFLHILMVLLLAAGYYYLWFRQANLKAEEENDTKQRTLASLMSYLGTLVLMTLGLAVFDDKVWAPAAWSGLLLLLLSIGVMARDRRLVFQTALLSLVISFTSLAVIFPLYDNVNGRYSMACIIAGLILARILWQIGVYNVKHLYSPGRTVFGELTGATRHVFSMNAAVLLLIYLPFAIQEGNEHWLSGLWAAEALILLILGFSLSDRALRVTGVFILVISIIQTFHALAFGDLDINGKAIALIGPGLILIVTGFIYSRFRDQIPKTFLKD